MNLGKKPAAPKSAGFEAQAHDLSPRGEVREYLGKSFPPDEWVAITEREAGMLKHKPLKIRPRDGGAPSHA